jgi:hypothetical protein
MGLRVLEKAGKIRDLEHEPRFPIVINATPICTVILDASWRDEAGMHYADFKGMDTPMSKLKRKLVQAVKGIQVEVVRA